MVLNDHAPLHFHVQYAEFKATVALLALRMQFADGTVGKVQFEQIPSAGYPQRERRAIPCLSNKMEGQENKKKPF